MTIINMPNCCGCILIKNFGHSHANGEDLMKNYKPSVDEVYNFLIRITKDRNRMYVAYITKEQYLKIGKGLTKAGFKRTSTCYHSGHQSIIYQYTLSNKGVKQKYA